MALKNCPECGTLYLENLKGMCPNCYARQQDDIYRIDSYLEKVKKATLEEIETATGINRKFIMRMVKAGRLFGDYQIIYPCECCGQPTTKDRLCNACKSGFLDQARQAALRIGEQKRSNSLAPRRVSYGY